MSYHNPIKRLLSRRRLDVTCAKVGVLLSVLLGSLQLFASQVFLVVIPLATGTGSLLYLGLVNRRASAFEMPRGSRWHLDLLPAVVYGGLATVLFLIHAAGQRTVPVYLLTGVIGAAIILQTLLCDRDRFAPGSVLTQILVVAVVVRLSALYATPGYVGVDIWTHVPDFVAGIADTGSLAPLAESKYLMAPLYHVFGAVATLILGSARDAIYLTYGLVLPLSALFVYATTRLLTGPRWAILATALYAFSDQFIRWGIHIIPTSLGLVFFLGATYCVTKLYVSGASRWVVVVLGIYSLATVFTHQISTAIVLTFLGIAAGVAVTAKRLPTETDMPEGGRVAASLTAMFCLVAVVTVVSWANTPWIDGEIFLFKMTEILGETLAEQAGFLNLASETGGGGEVIRETAEKSPWQASIPYIEVIGFTLLLAATVVGGLFVLRRQKHTAVSLTHLLTGIATFTVVFGFSLFGIRTLLPGRWIAFMYVPLAIIGSLGVYYVSGHAGRRVILAVAVVLALGYPTTMVVAEKATLDSPAFEEEHTRFAYTEQEIAGVQTIDRIRPESIDEDIFTDHPYIALYERVGGFHSQNIAVYPNGSRPPEAVVYREYQSRVPVTVHVRGDPLVKREQVLTREAVCPDRWNHVYGNGEVRLCVPSSAREGDGA